MDRSPFHLRTGAEKMKPWYMQAMIWFICIFVAKLISKGGIPIAGALLAIPFVIHFVNKIFKDPQIAIQTTLIMSFLASGLSRYVPLPWGMSIDVLLFIAWLGVLFKKFKYTDWSPMQNDLVMLSVYWYGYIILEIVNPEARSVEAWIYAMRGVGFYQLLCFPLVFMLYRTPKDFEKFMFTIMFISVMGTLWGLRQKIFGTDAAEDYWLYVEEHYDEHILFGVLRVFSFYSDAGQFGASQAMMALVAGVVAIGPGIPIKTRLWYGTCALMTFIGFGISGTRGALAVPAFGGILFLVMTKNFRILILGLVGAFSVFFILKYTSLFHSVEQVRRMRTGLDPDNPSLNTRFRNQKTFRKYLKTRPLGGGIGTAGYWGQRFSPNTLLANTATDSWYVKIWAETGIIGLCFHVYILGYVLGKGGYIIWFMKDQTLRYKFMGLYSGIGGVIISSYGNQIFGQMPTGMVMNIGIPILFMGPLYDKMITEEKERQRLEAEKNPPPTL